MRRPASRRTLERWQPRQCFAHGLLAIFAFNRKSALQLMPPRVVEPDEVDAILERLETALAATPPPAG